MKKLLPLLVVATLLLSRVSADIRPPNSGPPAPPQPIEIDTSVWLTTVEIAWAFAPGELFGVQFYPESEGPPCATTECGWYGINDMVEGGVFQFGHTSPRGAFRVFKYHPNDEFDQPPPERFTPVRVESIRFISRVEVVPEP